MQNEETETSNFKLQTSENIQGSKFNRTARQPELDSGLGATGLEVQEGERRRGREPQRSEFLTTEHTEYTDWGES